MNRKILIALGIVATLALGGAMSTVQAACDAGTQFNLAFGASDHFLVFPADTNKTVGGGVFLGRWWQPGNRNAANEGAGTAEPCPESSYMITDPPGGVGDAQTFFGFQGGDFGQGACLGAGVCTNGTMIVLFQTLSNDASKAYYAIGKTTQGGGGEFDFGIGGAVDWTLTEVPRPRVTASSRAGGTVTVNLVFDPPAGARGEAGGFPAESLLTGYQVVRFEGTGDPGRGQGLWTALGSVIPVTNTGAVVAGVGAVCSGTTNDVFLATRPVFDGGQYSGDYVSASTRIECDPTLADPRFKMIDKSKSGRGSVRPN